MLSLYRIAPHKTESWGGKNGSAGSGPRLGWPGCNTIALPRLRPRSRCPRTSAPGQRPCDRRALAAAHGRGSPGCDSRPQPPHPGGPPLRLQATVAVAPPLACHATCPRWPSGEARRRRSSGRRRRRGRHRTAAEGGEAEPPARAVGGDRRIIADERPLGPASGCGHAVGLPVHDVIQSTADTNLHTPARTPPAVAVGHTSRHVRGGACAPPPPPSPATAPRLAAALALAVCTLKLGGSHCRPAAQRDRRGRLLDNGSRHFPLLEPSAPTQKHHRNPIYCGER